MNDLTERMDSYLRMMERIPTRGYLGLALGSIAVSALLRIAGKKEAALFVGQWPPTLLLFGLVHTLLQPSEEPGRVMTRDAVADAGQVVGSPTPESASPTSL